jgi:hypothetical protein
MDAQALRDLTAGLLKEVEDMRGQLWAKDREIVYRQTRIDQLTHEMAVLKRYQFGKRSEQLDSTQRACWTRASMPISRPSKKNSHS